MGMPIIPALNRLRHEDCEFKASLHRVNCLKKERQRDLEGETEPSPPLKETATLKSAEVPYGAQPSRGAFEGADLTSRPCPLPWGPL